MSSCMSKESDSSITFRHWLRRNYKKFPCCTFEMKDTRGLNYLNYRENIKEEQTAHGIACKSEKGNLVRVSSGTVGSADYYFMRNAQAYVVIKYPKSFEIIDVETLELEMKKTKCKSLTAERANKLSVYSIGV